MKKFAKRIIVVITLVLIILLLFICYCLDRGRISREFCRYIADTDYVWEAQEIDCVLYGRETETYGKMKEEYDVDVSNEEEEALLGELRWDDTHTPMLFQFAGPGNHVDLAEVYYDTEEKVFNGYSDVMTGGGYHINFWKNKFTVRIEEDYCEIKDNTLMQYLKEQHIEKITFVKSKESEGTFGTKIEKEDNKTLYERYKKAFGVNVLTAKYNKNKERIEITIQNNKDYDIGETYCLYIGIIGKTAYSLANKWEYQETLPYDQGYIVLYFDNKKLKEKSSRKIVIPNIKDDEIVNIKAEMAFYDYGEKTFENPSRGYFGDIVDEEAEQYFKEYYSFK